MFIALEAARALLAHVENMNINDAAVLSKYSNILMSVANAARLLKSEELSSAVLFELDRLKNTLGVDQTGKRKC